MGLTRGDSTHPCCFEVGIYNGQEGCVANCTPDVAELLVKALEWRDKLKTLRDRMQAVAFDGPGETCPVCRAEHPDNGDWTHEHYCPFKLLEEEL